MTPMLRQEVATVIGDHLRVVSPSLSSVDVETAFASHTADSRGGCAAARAQAARAGMEGRCPGRSRGQQGDDRETSNLEAVEG